MECLWVWYGMLGEFPLYLANNVHESIETKPLSWRGCWYLPDRSDKLMPTPELSKKS